MPAFLIDISCPFQAIETSSPLHITTLDHPFHSFKIAVMCCQGRLRPQILVVYPRIRHRSVVQSRVRARSGSHEKINTSQVAREVAPFFQHCTIENVQFVFKSENRSNCSNFSKKKNASSDSHFCLLLVRYLG